jgi:hypothetical protein
MGTMGTKSKISGKKKAEFNRRLLKIYDKLPTDFVNRVIKIKPDASANRIGNVRYNKTVDFEILSILERIANENK